MTKRRYEWQKVVYNIHQIADWRSRERIGTITLGSEDRNFDPLTLLFLFVPTNTTREVKWQKDDDMFHERGLAQRERVGLITSRSEDRNFDPLKFVFFAPPPKNTN